MVNQVQSFYFDSRHSSNSKKTKIFSTFIRYKWNFFGNQINDLLNEILILLFRWLQFFGL